MRGLIEKDLRLMFKRKQILLVIVFVEIMLGISGSGNFAVVYFTLLGGIIAAGTLSYDEFDNGLEFLFTLPIDRKTYIRGKYVLCAAFCAAHPGAGGWGEAHRPGEPGGEDPAGA